VNHVIMRPRVVTALFLAITLCACSKESERPNIFLITVDTLRADSLSCYGYPRATTPFLDGLAAEGVRFDRAYSTSPWTVPSVASMLSSAYVNEHGLGRRFRSAPRTGWAVLPPDVPHVAELLHDAGYRTFGLVSNLNLRGERGFDRGFDRYKCVGSVDIDVVDAEIEPWLADISDGDGPWFFWLHLFDPHGPYDGREPWLEQFDAGWRRAARMNGLQPLAFAQAAKRAPANAIAVAKACYDSEIRAVDEFVKNVFDRLPEANDAFVLFSADHGEAFLEHGHTLHGSSLFDEQIRIPFIVRFHDRRSKGTVVTHPVSLVDVLPTLVGAAGLEPPIRSAGVNLAGKRGVEVPADRAIFAEQHSLRAVVDDRGKFLTSTSPVGTYEDKIFAPTDVGEGTNLAARLPGRVEEFKALLDGYEQRLRSEAPPHVDIQRGVQEKLRALGYVDDQ
jgi:arylsulfatase